MMQLMMLTAWRAIIYSWIYYLFGGSFWFPSFGFETFVWLPPSSSILSEWSVKAMLHNLLERFLKCCCFLLLVVLYCLVRYPVTPCWRGVNSSKLKFMDDINGLNFSCLIPLGVVCVRKRSDEICCPKYWDM